MSPKPARRVRRGSDSALGGGGGGTGVKRPPRARRLPRAGTAILLAGTLLYGMYLSLYGLLAREIYGTHGPVIPALVLGGLALAVFASYFTRTLWSCWALLLMQFAGIGLNLIWMVVYYELGWTGWILWMLGISCVQGLLAHQAWRLVRDARARRREQAFRDRDLEEDIAVEPGWDQHTEG